MKKQPPKGGCFYFKLLYIINILNGMLLFICINANRSFEMPEIIFPSTLETMNEGKEKEWNEILREIGGENKFQISI